MVVWRINFELDARVLALQRETLVEGGQDEVLAHAGRVPLQEGLLKLVDFSLRTHVFVHRTDHEQVGERVRLRSIRYFPGRSGGVRPRADLHVLGRLRRASPRISGLGRRDDGLQKREVGRVCAGRYGDLRACVL